MTAWSCCGQHRRCQGCGREGCGPWSALRATDQRPRRRRRGWGGSVDARRHGPRHAAGRVRTHRDGASGRTCPRGGSGGPTSTATTDATTSRGRTSPPATPASRRRPTSTDQDLQRPSSLSLSINVPKAPASNSPRSPVPACTRGRWPNARVGHGGCLAARCGSWLASSARQPCLAATSTAVATCWMVFGSCSRSRTGSLDHRWAMLAAV